MNHSHVPSSGSAVPRLTREEFLSRVRTGLRGTSAQHAHSPSVSAHADGSSHPVPPALPDDLIRLEHASADLAEVFARRAAAVGMRVHRVNQTELQSSLAAELQTHAGGSGGDGGVIAVSVADDSLRATAIAAVVQTALHECHWRDSQGLHALYDAAVGITDVAAAIAETGSLVVQSAANTTRGGFLVPPVHIALVRAEQIVPDLIDLFVAPSTPPPTSLVLITGPSKTADIEGILVTGVHGPREVVILLIE